MVMGLRPRQGNLRQVFRLFKSHPNFFICLLLLENLPKLMHNSAANDVTSCDIDTAVVTQIFFNSVHISSNK